MKYIVFLAALGFASSAIVAATPTFAELPAAHHSVWSGQEISFGNGAKIKVAGSMVTTTSPDGKVSTTDRSDPAIAGGGKTPIVASPFASCSYMRHWLDSHPVNNTWRANSLTYADRCF